MANLLIAYKGSQKDYLSILKKYYRELRIWYETVSETTRISYIEGTKVIKEIKDRLDSSQAIILSVDEYLKISKRTDKKVGKSHHNGYCLLIKAQIDRIKELQERGFTFVIYLPLELADDDSEIYEQLYSYAGEYYIDSYDLFVYKETL